MTHNLDLIHIVIKFHQDILYGYLVMACIRIVSEKKNYQREVTQKLRKGELSFLYVTHHLNLIHIVIKFYQEIPYGYLLMVHTRLV